MSYLDLINAGLLDEYFPYPLAFETCYNLATQFINLLTYALNFLAFFVVAWLIVFITKSIFSFMK